MAMTQEALEKNRAFYKANPELAAKLMSQLSPEAQEHAKKIGEIYMDEANDAATVHEKIEAYKATLPKEIRDALEENKKEWAANAPQ